MKRWIGIAAGTALLFVMLINLGGCNTVEGAGEDISAAGQAVSGASQAVQGRP